MNHVVAVVHDKKGDKSAALEQLLQLSDFDAVLDQAQADSHKQRSDFRIVIKPNMMVFVNPRAFRATVTDREMVEWLVDHIRSRGYHQITLCEAQHDLGRILRNHNVKFVAEQIGFRPDGRYTIADLSLEAEPFAYRYRDLHGNERLWKDMVGRTWRDADFRISFAKCKTHEHDWMTLSVKNIYGCFPCTDKVCRYHIRNEIFDVTARSLANFPVHFALVDDWVGSDGFLGYKLDHPRELRMLFAGADPVAVDLEIFRRAGLDGRKSKILRRSVEQGSGRYPDYVVRGDSTTVFNDLGPWDNISDDIVRSIDHLEEVYVAWGLINLKPAAIGVDYKLFPPRTLFDTILVLFTKKLYAVFKLMHWYRKLYDRRRG